jgi:hypothetical protein
MTRTATALLGLVLLGGCGIKDLYWNHPDATKDQFLAALRKCRIEAKFSIPEREHVSCHYDASLGGTYCKEETVLDAAVREERERLMREDVKNACMEERGWSRSEDGVGFREVRKQPRLPEPDSH